jgi:hypothetical protein
MTNGFQIEYNLKSIVNGYLEFVEKDFEAV